MVTRACYSPVSYTHLDVYKRQDMALRAGYDVRHCVVGQGVYASHGYERTHIDGVRNTLALLEAYTR